MTWRARSRVLIRDIVAEHESSVKPNLTRSSPKINPHFLYNTLDIIVWMIENEQGSGSGPGGYTALARFFHQLKQGEEYHSGAGRIRTCAQLSDDPADAF